MRLPALSLCMTVNERPLHVLESVFRSILSQDAIFEQLVICFDGTTANTRENAKGFWYNHADLCRWIFPEIDRPPGWISPVRAWNRAFQEVTSELTYCISSEVIQAPVNILRAKEILKDQPAVLFGKCECSCGPEGKEVNWNGAAPGNLLVDSAHPRPLGFIMAMPTWVLRATGGMDEGFADGFWHDDDDFMYRIWQQGVPFIFDDEISGIHQHHERPVLETPEGQAKIELNRSYMLKKWGTLSPWNEAPKRMERESPTRTIIWPA